jgi:hypothetical protein
MRTVALVLAVGLLGGCSNRYRSKIEERGPFRLHEYARGPGSWHGMPSFTEVRVKGEPYRPFGDDFHFCSLDPAPRPEGVVCSESSLPGRTGMYLVFLKDGRPAHVRLNGRDVRGDGGWSPEGRWYLHGDTYYDARTGESLVAPWRGEPIDSRPSGQRMLSLSPDGTVMLWRALMEVRPVRRDVLRLSRVADGETLRTLTLVHAEHPEVYGHRHALEDRKGHSLPEHFQWVRDAAGVWDVRPVGVPPR